MARKLYNRRWVLAEFPESMPKASHFLLEENLPLTPLEDNQILVQACYLSVDPYMRGRISPTAGYTAGVEPGGLMPAGGVGEIIESRSNSFKVGEFVESMNSKQFKDVENFFATMPKLSHTIEYTIGKKKMKHTFQGIADFFSYA